MWKALDTEQHTARVPRWELRLLRPSLGAVTRVPELLHPQSQRLSFEGQKDNPSERLEDLATTVPQRPPCRQGLPWVLTLCSVR